MAIYTQSQEVLNRLKKIQNDGNGPYSLIYNLFNIGVTATLGCKSKKFVNCNFFLLWQGLET